MSAATGVLILGETAALAALLWGFRHEKAVIDFENRQAKKLAAALRRKARQKENRRRRRLNAKALYTPVGKRPTGFCRERMGEEKSA